MKAEEKQALIEHAKTWIANCEAMRDEIPFGLDSEAENELSLIKIALAALTAQPVKLPHEWVHIRFTDRSKSQRMKCQIAWSDSLNSVIYDEEGAPSLLSNGAFEVILRNIEEAK